LKISLGVGNGKEDQRIKGGRGRKFKSKKGGKTFGTNRKRVLEWGEGKKEKGKSPQNLLPRMNGESQSGQTKFKKNEKNGCRSGPGMFTTNGAGKGRLEKGGHAKKGVGEKKDDTAKTGKKQGSQKLTRTRNPRRAN